MIFQGRPRLVLLDPGSQVAVLSTAVARRLGIMLYIHHSPVYMQSYHGEINEVADKYFTVSITRRRQPLRHLSHSPFEPSRLEDQCDAIFPHWSPQEYQPSNIYSADLIQTSFDSARCRQPCTISACVAAFAKAPADIPERFRHLVPLQETEAPKQPSQRLPTISHLTTPSTSSRA
jgi:hypothetical protein